MVGIWNDAVGDDRRRYGSVNPRALPAAGVVPKSRRHRSSFRPGAIRKFDRNQLVYGNWHAEAVVFDPRAHFCPRENSTAMQ